MNACLAIRLAFAAALAAGSAAAADGGAVTVIGDGYAQDCWLAAIDGKSDDASMQICGTALASEVLSRHDRGATFINRGVMKMRRRDFAGAMVDLNAGVRLAPEAGEGWTNRGGALIGVKRYSEGLGDINRGLALGVKEPEKAYFNRALAYEGLDDEKAAYFDYQKALALKPGWALPQQELLRFTVSRQ